MENGLSWDHNTLISELIQGMEVARKLKADLRTSSSAATRDLLVQRILSSYEKALLILRWNSSNSKSYPRGSAAGSPISAIGSPMKDDIDEGLKDQHELNPESKKRKMMPRWVDQVRVSSETSLEGPHDDGYSWRKYGQKDILGAKYPRSYYRCTYRNTQSCWATKQVQRSDEDPTIFDITYRGKHTCSQGNNAILSPKSPDKQENPRHYNDNHPQLHLTEFKDILCLNTDNLEDREIACPLTSPMTSFGYMTQKYHSMLPLSLENDSFPVSVSQTHFPPITPEPIYYSFPSFKINEFDGHRNNQRSESDITEILSANTSATNSPIPDFNFSLDPVEIDPNFPFDTPGFFS